MKNPMTFLPFPDWASRLADRILKLQQPKRNSYAVLLGRDWDRLCRQIKRKKGEHEPHYYDRLKAHDAARRNLEQIEQAALRNDAEFFEDFAFGMRMDERADDRNKSAIRVYKWMMANHAEVERCKNYDELIRLLGDHLLDDAPTDSKGLERTGREIGLSFRRQKAAG